MQESPFVTIIMPVHNEAKHLEQSLGAVLRQDYPPEKLEVLVADGMSDDGTREVIGEFAGVRLIDNPARIVPAGMNIALRESLGDIIIRVDGHTIIENDYVRQCVMALERTGADNVGGKMDASGQGSFGQAVALATSSPFGVGGARFHYSDKEEWVDTVYMGAWPRRVFEKIGLFDEELVRDQDDEFNYRLSEHGGRILLSPEIKSNYTVRGTVGSLWKQYFQYGFWKVRVLQKHPKQMKPRQFIPPLFIGALATSVLITGLFPWGWISLALIAGSYLASNLVATVQIAAAKGWKDVILLPIAFAILHLSYGMGFLVGLARFANRWGDKIGKVRLLEPG